MRDVDNNAGDLLNTGYTVAANAISANPERLVEHLNTPQKQAVLHQDGPLLILAGAGSGKTRVITHRIAWLVEACRISPASILAITFTNKAAGEMRTRIQELIGAQTQGMWVGTFHSMMVRVLRMHADRLDFTSRFSIVDSDDQLKLIKEATRDLNLDEKIFPPRTTANYISGAKNKLQTAERFLHLHEKDFRLRKIAEIFTLYQNRLKAADAMDFDDILFNAVRLLKENPDILEHYQQRFRYILVDEYQDTNGAQYQLICLLSAAHRNLCVVGDDDQSIYSFRGADISNILSFEKDFPECQVIKLEENYRSTGTVLAAANALIANNEGRKEKKLWTQQAEGEKITCLYVGDQNQESRQIALEISRLVNQEKRFKYADIALLYRMNALSRSLEFSLREYGIPYRIYGGLRFYDRKEIKDVLAYLRLLANPADSLAFSRILNVPRRGIGEVTQAAIFEAMETSGLNAVEVCRHATQFPTLSRQAPRLTLFAQLLDRLKQQLEEAESFASFVDFVENETGIIQEIITHSDKGAGDKEERLENLRELLSDVVEFERAPLPPDVIDITDEEENLQQNWTRRELLEAFLERVVLSSALDQEEGDDNHVKLLTIHSAKGLEFDLVFLVGMEEGIFPGFQSLQTAEGLEEERRLAYVAVTRAKKKLYITMAKTRLLFGRTSAQQLSRFVSEIPGRCLQIVQSEQRYGGATAERHFGGGAWSTSGRDFADTSHLSAHSTRGASSSSAPTIKSYRAPGRDPNLYRSPTAVSRLQTSSQEQPEGALTLDELQVGMKVKHARFGEGEILKLVPASQDAILEIAFADGNKKMMAKLAKLTRC